MGYCSRLAWKYLESCRSMCSQTLTIMRTNAAWSEERPFGDHVYCTYPHLCYDSNVCNSSLCQLMAIRRRRFHQNIHQYQYLSNYDITCPSWCHRAKYVKPWSASGCCKSRRNPNPRPTIQPKASHWNMLEAQQNVWHL